MKALDLAYHMRDHTPRWLMRMNLLMIPLAIIWVITLWWPAFFSGALLMGLNLFVGVRSFRTRVR